MDTYWVRVKPLNRKRGHVVERVHVLGRLWIGGNGIQPDKIPEWVKVNAKQAAFLKQNCKQMDSDPYSEPIFDIVTDEQRRAIDFQEEAARKALLGYGSSLAINELPDISAKEADATGKAKVAGRMTLADLTEDEPTLPRTAPAPTDLTSGSVGTLPGIRKETATSLKAKEIDLSGRAAAIVAPPETPAEPVQAEYIAPPAVKRTQAKRAVQKPVVKAKAKRGK